MKKLPYLKRLLYLLILIALAVVCKKPYNPKVIAPSKNYQVVERVINRGPDDVLIAQ